MYKRTLSVFFCVCVCFILRAHSICHLRVSFYMPLTCFWGNGAGVMSDSVKENTV